MPLHLAHHKSYHPYNRVNQERVARDQALEAQRQEQSRQVEFAHRDQARLEALRARRRQVEVRPSQRDQHEPTPTYSTPSRTALHSKPQSGHALLRPEDELAPWYTTSQLRNGAESRKIQDQQLEDAYKDSSRKSSNDPLKAMQAFLAQRKAAKDLPQRSSPSSSDITRDQYEPEAVRAAKARRREHSHRRSSHSHSTRESTSSKSRRHRSNNLSSSHSSDQAEDSRHYKRRTSSSR